MNIYSLHYVYKYEQNMLTNKSSRELTIPEEKYVLKYAKTYSNY
jgi:hypothetical protein